MRLCDHRMLERKGRGGMHGEALVSGGDRLRWISLSQGDVLAETTLEGCGAVCVHGEIVFAAVRGEEAIYRLDERLLPSGIYAGGPGMRTMCVSPDGERLYVLLADADSVLMLAAASGAPQLLARAGVNPRQMRLDAENELLVIAGGGDGCAHLLEARSLRLLRSIREEGVCWDAVPLDNVLYLLMLTPALTTLLVARSEREGRQCVALAGTPGSICRVADGMLWVCAGEWLYAVDPHTLRVARKTFAGSHAGKLIGIGRRCLLLNPVSERLWLLGMGQRRLLCRDAQDVATRE